MAEWDLTDLVAAVEAQARENQPDMTLTTKVTKGVPPRVELDDARLVQVLALLLEHAAAAGDDGRVSLSLTPSGREGASRRVRFEVRDHAAPATRAALVHPEESGGLTPALFRRLLASFTAEVGAHRSTLNGSTWWFVVSLRPVATFDQRPRVLVVDDNPVNRRVASHLLVKLGCVVDEAEDGSQAVVSSRDGFYDLILMDCQMPGMDGWSATAAIRRGESTRQRTPIVACTSLAGHDNRRRCLEVGMDGFMTKPMSAEAVHEVVNQWTGVD
ncbi:MAG: hypothetical protein DRQ55_16405 [Planctomycetota bacterium]|nr:MAG: hypothetical protein DRQ55_16405 [Planctomycetota bacterium]